VLEYVITQFESQSSAAGDLRRALHGYLAALVAEGLFARKAGVIYEGTGSRSFCLAGLLCYPRAMDDAASVPAMQRPLRGIESRIVGVPVNERFTLACGEDTCYCEHEEWRSLTLISDTILGTSPVVCNECGGIVARYRLRLGGPTGAQLWSWDVQYDSIFACWLASADYESWADKELHDVQSNLNEAGIALACSIAKDIACEVNYYLAASEDAGHARCPRCGEELPSIAGLRWEALCPHGHIVTIHA
jgi:hypothetical protein